MPRNGSGVYGLPVTTNPVISNSPITTTWGNGTLTDIANALTTSVSSDGQTTMTGSLNLGGQRIINVAIPTIVSDGARADGQGATGTWPISVTGNAATATTAVTATTATNAITANSALTAAALSATLVPSSGGTGLTSPGTTGNVLTSTGSAWSSAPIPTQPFGLGGIKVFTSNGTFTIPANKSVVKVSIAGAGGGGGGAAVSAVGNGFNGGGGGAGMTIIFYLSNLTGGNTISVTAGAGGTGGTNGSFIPVPTSGGAGGNSSISSGTQTIATVTAGGGGGGAMAGSTQSGAGGSAGSIVTAPTSDYITATGSLGFGGTNFVSVGGMSFFSNRNGGDGGLMSASSGSLAPSGQPGLIVFEW